MYNADILITVFSIRLPLTEKYKFSW